MFPRGNCKQNELLVSENEGCHACIVRQADKQGYVKAHWGQIKYAYLIS